MSLSPVPGDNEINSPDVFRDVRCNLDSRFLHETETTNLQKMSVYARVRPLLPKEEARGHKICIAAIDETTVRAIVPETSIKYRHTRNEEIFDFPFTAAFGPESGQFVFFQETVLKSMKNFVQGSNSLIFSYGITGSGKTFTLQGNPENPGIIPLSLRLYFASIENQLMKNIVVKPYLYDGIIPLSDADKQKELQARRQIFSLYDEECETAPGSFRNNNSKTFAMTLCDLFSDDCEVEERQTTLSTEDMASAQAAAQLREVIRGCVEEQDGVCSIWISFVEIYNESIFDLLQPVTSHRSRLSIGEDKNGNVYVKGALEICVFNSDEALKLLNIGRKHLSIASTKMNYQSSRSHCIYTIRVVRVPDVTNINRARVNRLSFCDLAGSERTSKTHTTGVRLKEAGAINTSLLVLGRCLQHLRLHQSGRDLKMIPFRESKLTRIFSGFFMGQGQAVMIANASPSDYTFDETLHVLKFSAGSQKLFNNDTFYSAASTTIQSICSQWEMCKTNTSMYNESMESIESDSDIIQQKDELIEKLLKVAQDCAKKEQEMADMELRIRQEVSKEFVESSDQLIEEYRQMHKEEITALKESYQKRLAKMEKMYEEIIKKYRDQLSEYEEEESFNIDKTIDISNLSEDSNDSVHYSSSRTELDQNGTKESTKCLNAEIDSLKSELELVRNEMLKTKEELLEKQNKISTLESELSVSRAECKRLVDQCEVYQEKMSESSQVAVNCKTDLEELEKELSSTRKELSSVKETVQNKEFNIHELETENSALREEIQAFEHEVNVLKRLKSSQEEKIENYKTKITSMKDQVDLNEKEYAALKEQLQTTFDSNLQMETEVFAKKIKKQEKEIIELKKANEGNEKQTLKYKNDLSSLEEKLLASHTDYNKAKKVQCDTISGLEKEIQALRKEISSLEEKVAELNTVKVRYEKEIENYGNTISDLKSKLNSSQSESASAKEIWQTQKDNISALEKEIDALKQKNSTLQEDYQNVCSEKVELKKELSSSKEQLTLTNDKLQQLSTNLQESANQIEKYKKNAKEIVEIEKELSRLKEYLEIEKEDNQKKTIKLKKLEDVNKVYEVELEDLRRVENELKFKLECVNETIKSSRNDKQNSSKLVELASRNKIYELEIEELRGKCFLSNEELKSLKEDNLKKSEKVTQLEKREKDCELIIESLEKDIQNVSSKKKELQGRLSLIEQELETVKDDLQQKSLRLAEFENCKNNCELEGLEKEMQNLSEKITAEAKLNVTRQESLTVKDDVPQKSSEPEEMKNCKYNYEQEIETMKKEMQNLLSEKTELQMKLSMTEKELQIKSSEIAELENCKNDSETKLDNLKEDMQNVLSEKMKLDAILVETEQELVTLKNDIQQKSSELVELENLKNKCEIEKEKLQESHQNVVTKNEELEEKLKFTTNELEIVKRDFQQQSLKVIELENDLNAYKVTVENLEKKNQILESEKREMKSEINSYKENINELEEKLSQYTKETDNATEMSQNLAEMEKDLNAYKVAVENLEQKYQILESENMGMRNEINSHKESIIELEENRAEMDKEISKYNQDIKNLNENLQIAEEEKQDLMVIISQNEKKIKDFEEELSAVNDELNTSKDEIVKKAAMIQVLEKTLAEKDILINILEVIECKATNQVNSVNNNFSKQKALIQDLRHQITNKESSIEELEKGLTDSQEKLKEMRSLNDNKLIAEKEQHMIEIQETIKLKHEVEEENARLKEENLKLKENLNLNDLKKDSKESKEINKKGTVPKATAKSQNIKMPSKEKENLPKATSKSTEGKEKQMTKSLPARTLRQKQIKVKDISFSSVDSLNLSNTESEVPRRNRKRISDEEFCPDKDRATKKMKSVEDSKIPVKRTSRRRQQVDLSDNLSPVQKIANTISNKFKVIADKVSSPRVTRGRKKLFNPELPSSSKSEKVIRGKKS